MTAPSGSGAPRDDGAPTDAMLAWVSEKMAEDAVQWEEDAKILRVRVPSRPDATDLALERARALRWLAAHLSSLIADSADLIAIREKCRVVYYPPLSDPTGTYPIEHTMAARKDSWDTIIATLRAVRATPHGSEQ